jgi:hypothetical protein
MEMKKERSKGGELRREIQVDSLTQDGGPFLNEENSS